MGQWNSINCGNMLITLVYTFILTLTIGSAAEATTYMRSVVIPTEVRTEFEALRRYCGNNYGYYRPTSYRPSISSLVGPAILGFGAGATAVGSLAALQGILGTPGGGAAPHHPQESTKLVYWQYLHC